MPFPALSFDGFSSFPARRQLSAPAGAGSVQMTSGIIDSSALNPGGRYSLNARVYPAVDSLGRPFESWATFPPDRWKIRCR
jgi:hypothetical protein